MRSVSPSPPAGGVGGFVQLANSLKCAFAAFFQCREQSVYTGFAAGPAVIRNRRGGVKGGAMAGGRMRPAIASRPFRQRITILAFFSCM